MQHTMSQGLSGTLCTRRIPRPSVVLLPKRSSSASTAPSSKLVTVRASNDDEVFKERKFKDFALRSREAVLRAVEELGNSATAAEVASKAALPVQEAEQCLQALAIDGSGSLKVTEAGDVIYTFPENVGVKLQQQDLYLQGEAAAKSASKFLERAARISFGVVLVASIAFSTVAIAALAIAASSSDNNNSGSRGFSFEGGNSNNYENGGGGEMFGGGGNMWLWIDPWPTMYGAPNRRSEDPNQDGRGLGGFFEDAFSIVFGGPNPNDDFDEQRWRAIGERISLNGGVVAAEQIVPLLDLADDTDLEDEAYMLPVLLRFNGTVDVVTLPSGNPAILYRFPDLQKRAALPALGAAPPSALAGTAQFGFRRAIGKAASWIQEVRNGGEGSLEAQAGSKDAYVAYSGEQPFAEQKPWKLFDVNPSNVVPLVLLATLNTTLLVTLSSYVSNPVTMQLLRQSAGPGFTSLVATVAPALCFYASLYILGPALRYIQNQMRNSRIEQGNRIRRRFAQALDVPSPELQSKLARANRESQVVDISRAPVAYDTAQPTFDSSEDASRKRKTDVDFELDDFDTRLRRRK